jgi:hypothetical protein
VGVSAGQSAENDLHAAFGVAQNVIVPETQHSEALALKVGVSCTVCSLARFEPMLSTVDLDDNPGRIASEVDDEVIDWHLAAKVKAVALQ